MKKRLLSLLLAGSMVLSIGLAGCGQKTTDDNQTIDQAQQEVKPDDKKEETATGYEGPKVLDYYMGDEPETFDQTLITGQPEMFLLNMFVEGLMRSGQVDGEAIPGVASGYTLDDSTNTYTFALNPNAKWKDGTPVTAEDFVFGWRLALDEDAPYYNLITDYITGTLEYYEYNTSAYLAEVDAAFAGMSDEDKAKRIEAMTDEEKAAFQAKKDGLWSNVKVAINGSDLAVTLNYPTPYFPYVTTMPVYMPLNQKFYEERKAAGDYVIEISGLNANGPWVPVEWKHNDSMKFVKNDNYWNKDNINIDEINLKVVVDVATRTNLLKTGKLDGSAIQADDVREFEDLATLNTYDLQPMVNMPDFASFYLEFNHFGNQYTQNANVRKALAYAMDRQSFVEKINLGDEPSLGFIPTFFPGLEKSFREENGMALFEDNQKDKAKEHLEAALKELGISQLPPLDMLIGQSDVAKKIAEKFQQDWAEVGITVNLIPLTWGERMSRVKAGDFAIYSGGWGPDYPDPMTFIDLWHSKNGNNHGIYNNPKYDELVDKAKIEKDPKVRMGYMYEAEKILIDDMAIAPQYYRIAHWTFRNYLTGVVNRGIGAATDFYWADIDMNAKLGQ